MNALIVALAVVAQWDMSPGSSRAAKVFRSAWDMKPVAAAPDLTNERIQNLIDASTKPPLASGEAAHTPMNEVTRVIQLLPKPEVGFVDFGCGYDARWCVAAAERWGCKVTGIEIDPDRAAAARKHVRELGLDHLITIVEGDATEVDYAADVGVAYLYGDVLERLRPRLERLRAFASYLHRPPGLPVTQHGDTWLYSRPAQAVDASRPYAIWDNRIYYAPECDNPKCGMCYGPGGIAPQIAAMAARMRQATADSKPAKRPQLQRLPSVMYDAYHLTAPAIPEGYTGQYVLMKYCQNGRCWHQWDHVGYYVGG